jgi:hypothetical protein
LAASGHRTGERDFPKPAVKHWAMHPLCGSPDATLDPTALNDIGWTLNVPTDGVTARCSASFTIADVAFVSN